MENRKLNIGIIGAGRIGKVHTESIALRMPEVQIAAVADPNIKEAEMLAEKFQIPSVVNDPEIIFNDDEVDAVIICSPTNMHSQHIKQAAGAGKHIFCEKPVDLSIEKINDCINAVKESGVSFMVGFNRRFDPNFSRIRSMVGNGKIGEPHILRITSRDPQPPNIDYVKVSGGIFLDMTIHDFDMARFMAGSEVNEVYARGNVLVDSQIGAAGDIDTAVVVLNFENGATGVIDNSRKAVYGYDQRVEIFGSGGMISAQNNKPENYIYLNSEGEHSALPLNFFMDRYTESYFREMRAFIDCVLNGSEPPVTGKDGLMAVAIGLAAKRSVKENRPVSLSEILCPD